MSTPVKWTAELANVREVSLLGTADLAFWQSVLATESLVPDEKDGQAQILIVAASLRFLAVPFTEVSVSVLVSPPLEWTSRDAAFLVQAFNTSRLFAYSERVLFSTPYYHGDVLVSTVFPCSIQLVKGGELVLRAEMRADPASEDRLPSRDGEEEWYGPIFLAGRPRRGKGQGQFFFGKLQGSTLRFPFQPLHDLLTIRPLPGCAVLQALVDSHFDTKEWIVRTDARHARSKTYRRSEWFAGP